MDRLPRTSRAAAVDHLHLAAFIRSSYAFLSPTHQANLLSPMTAAKVALRRPGPGPVSSAFSGSFRKGLPTEECQTIEKMRKRTGVLNGPGTGLLTAITNRIELDRRPTKCAIITDAGAMEKSY